MPFETENVCDPFSLMLTDLRAAYNFIKLFVSFLFCNDEQF